MLSPDRLVYYTAWFPVYDLNFDQRLGFDRHLQQQQQQKGFHFMYMDALIEMSLLRTNWFLSFRGLD